MAKDKDKDTKLEEAKQDRFEGSGGGMNTGVALIGFVLCFIAGMGLMWGYDKHNGGKGGITADSAAAGVWSDEESPVPISSKDPMWGNRAAPVTIVEFSDFQCPFCGRVEPTLEQVKTTYGPDKVRIIWKHEPLPFHDKAKPAAEAAAGVFALKGSDAFWKFHDTAFKNQSSLSPESYEKWAKDAGVTDIAKFKAGLAAHTWAKKVDDDHEIAKKSGVNGTPAFFINGVSISGAQPFDKFKAVIDEELKKAQAKIASGTAKDRVYVAMSQDNKKNAPAAKDDDDDEKQDNAVYKVPVGNSPIQGNKNALVTIVEFSDFQCPFCKRVEPTMKQIKDTYGDKVRVVWKHEPLPFHPRAEPAAELSLEARAEKGDKGFWDAHDKLFDIQPKLEDADLEKAAGDLGLDVGKVKDAIKSHKYKKDIDDDSALGDDVQASGTPHFFVNGKRLVGAQPFEKFKTIIDAEIANANALVAKGTPADKLYETIIKDGKGAPAAEKKSVPLPTGNFPYRGPEKAKVVIQEFSDFQCPFCGKVEPTVQQILKDYGDKVKFIWRDKPLPMHADAPLAGQAAREAFKQKGNDGFWKMHDTLFANQSKDGALKRDALDGYAKTQGLDMDKWKAALDSGSHKAEMDVDSKAADDAGISGTPAFVINGYFISGAQPYPKFKKLIDKALDEANK